MSGTVNFTGTSDTNKLILMKLSPEQVMNICTVNRYFSNLCKDYLIWEYYLVDHFGSKMLRYTTMRPLEFYWHLRTLFNDQFGQKILIGKNNSLNNALIAARDGYIPILDKIMSHRKFNRNEIFRIYREALTNCQIGAISYLFNTEIITIDDLNDGGGLLYANMGIEMARFLLEKGVNINLEEAAALNIAASEKNYELAKLYLSYGGDKTKIEKRNRNWLKSQGLID